MTWNVDSLFWLRHDKKRFEEERARVINDFMDTVPAEHQESCRSMQAKIDQARATMTDAELLEWFKQQASELAANISDSFAYIGHKADDMRKDLLKIR